MYRLQNLLKYLVIIWLALAVGFFVVDEFFKSDDTGEMTPYLEEAYGENFKFDKVSEEPLVYEVKDGLKTIGYASITKEFGYQSDITVLTSVDLEGKVSALKVINEDETPSYMRKLYNQNYLEQFVGQSISEGFHKGNINTVAGATVSSVAIARAANVGVFYIGDKYFAGGKPSAGFHINIKAKDLVLIGLMIFVLVASFLKKNKLRYVSLFISLITLGFYYNLMLGYVSFPLALSGNFPDISENLSWYVLLFGSILMILLSGKNLYCQWICPFGGLQEFIGKIFKQNKMPSHWLHNILKYIPAILVWSTLIIALLYKRPAIVGFEPFGTLFSFSGNAFEWIIVAVVLVSSIFINRFWCHYFCPVGYCLELITKIRRKVAKLWKKESK